MQRQVEIVGSQHDSRVPTVLRVWPPGVEAEELRQAGDSQRIERRIRLVEQQQAGPVQRGTGQGQALLLAARQLADRCRRCAGQPYSFHGRRGEAQVLGQPVQTPKEGQVL